MNTEKRQASKIEKVPASLAVKQKIQTGTGWLAKQLKQKKGSRGLRSGN